MASSSRKCGSRFGDLPTHFLRVLWARCESFSLGNLIQLARCPSYTTLRVTRVSRFAVKIVNEFNILSRVRLGKGLSD